MAASRGRLEAGGGPKAAVLAAVTLLLVVGAAQPVHAATTVPTAAAAASPTPATPSASDRPAPSSAVHPTPTATATAGATPSAVAGHTPATSTATGRTPAAATATAGGVVLDVFGGLHTFGNISLNQAGAPQWPGWNIARSVSVLPDGSGGWTLDGFGGVHSWGAAPNIAAPAYSSDTRGRAGVYWSGWDIARSLYVLPDGHSGYVLDGFGGIHAFGGAPQLPGTTQYQAGDPAFASQYWGGWDIARGLDVEVDGSGTPSGGAVLDAYGGVHAFGTYPQNLSNPYHHGSDVYLALHTDAGQQYTTAHFGIVTGVASDAATAFAPNWSGYADRGGSDVIRDVVLLGRAASPSAQPVSFLAGYDFQILAQPQRGTVVLDGYGGLHAAGGLTLRSANAPYWQGWDIARATAVLPDGSGGWTLDGYGGIHSWGGAAPVNAPSYGGGANARAAAYWNGWDIARDLYVLPDHRSGYVLDGYGGIHPFGGAPQIPGTNHYASGDPGFAAVRWDGWDIARSLTVHLDAGGVPDGGAVLDGWGAVHPFGATDASGGASYYPGRDAALKLRTTSLGHVYEVTRWGLVSPVGTSTLRPYWAGYGDWGRWDILRDIQLVGADDNTRPQAQPVSQAAQAAYLDVIWTVSLGVAPVTQSMPLDCETAALEEALRVKGVTASQSQLMGYEPDDGRAAVVSRGVVQRWGNPYTNFVGDPNGWETSFTGYGTYAPVIASVAAAFGRPAEVIGGGDVNQLFDAVSRGNAVVIWTSNTFQAVAMRTWTAWDGQSVPYALTEHAVTVVGINHALGTVTVNDVADGRDKTFSVSQFQSFWSSFGNMGVVVG